MYENDYDALECEVKSVEKRGEIVALSEELMRGVEVLQKEISALGDKLSPVLEIVPEVESTRDDASRPQSTELGQRLSSVLGNLSSAQTHLRSLRSRVAL